MGKKSKKQPEYDKIVSDIKRSPVTHLPGILVAVLKTSYNRKDGCDVFNERAGGVVEFVKLWHSKNVKPLNSVDPRIPTQEELIKQLRFIYRETPEIFEDDTVSLHSMIAGAAQLCFAKGQNNEIVRLAYIHACNGGNFHSEEELSKIETPTP